MSTGRSWRQFRLPAGLKLYRFLMERLVMNYYFVAKEGNRLQAAFWMPMTTFCFRTEALMLSTRDHIFAFAGRHHVGEYRR